MGNQKNLDGIYKLQQMVGENTRKIDESTKKIDKNTKTTESIKSEMDERFKQINERLDLIESTMRVLNEDTLKTRAEIDFIKRIN